MSASKATAGAGRLGGRGTSLTSSGHGRFPTTLDFALTADFMVELTTELQHEKFMLTQCD